jgi:hypothetical protein
LKVATEFAAIKTREGENGRWREAFEVVALRDRYGKLAVNAAPTVAAGSFPPCAANGKLARGKN